MVCVCYFLAETEIPHIGLNNFFWTTDILDVHGIVKDDITGRLNLGKFLFPLPKFDESQQPFTRRNSIIFLGFPYPFVAW
jgi:hypothetical protein